jgi:hypothetical protein
LLFKAREATLEDLGALMGGDDDGKGRREHNSSVLVAVKAKNIDPATGLILSRASQKLPPGVRLGRMW